MEVKPPQDQEEIRDNDGWSTFWANLRWVHLLMFGVMGGVFWLTLNFPVYIKYYDPEGELQMLQELSRTLRERSLYDDPEQMEELKWKKFKVDSRFDCSTMWLVVEQEKQNKTGAPGELSDVMVWMALYFRGEKRCKLIPPNWLDPVMLDRITFRELNSTLDTMTIKQYYAMAKTVWGTCSVGTLDGADVKTLVKEMWDSRMRKLRYPMSKPNRDILGICDGFRSFPYSLKADREFQKTITIHRL